MDLVKISENKDNSRLGNVMEGGGWAQRAKRDERIDRTMFSTYRIGSSSAVLSEVSGTIPRCPECTLTAAEGHCRDTNI